MKPLESFTLQPINGKVIPGTLLSQIPKLGQSSSVSSFSLGGTGSIVTNPFETSARSRQFPRSGTISTRSAEAYQACRTEVDVEHFRKEIKTLLNKSGMGLGKTTTATVAATADQSGPMTSIGDSCGSSSDKAGQREENVLTHDHIQQNTTNPNDQDGAWDTADDGMSLETRYLRSEIERRDANLQLLRVVEEKRQLRIQALELEADLHDCEQKLSHQEEKHHFELVKVRQGHISNGTVSSSNSTVAVNRKLFDQDESIDTGVDSPVRSDVSKEAIEINASQIDVIRTDIDNGAVKAETVSIDQEDKTATDQATAIATSASLPTRPTQGPEEIAIRTTTEAEKETKPEPTEQIKVKKKKKEKRIVKHRRNREIHTMQYATDDGLCGTLLVSYSLLDGQSTARTTEGNKMTAQMPSMPTGQSVAEPKPANVTTRRSKRRRRPVVLQEPESETEAEEHEKEDVIAVPEPHDRSVAPITVPKQREPTVQDDTTTEKKKKKKNNNNAKDNGPDDFFDEIGVDDIENVHPNAQQPRKRKNKQIDSNSIGSSTGSKRSLLSSSFRKPALKKVKRGGLRQRIK